MLETLVIVGVIVLIIVGGTVIFNLRFKRIVAYHRDHAASEPTDEVVQHVKRIVANQGIDPTDIFLDMTLEGDLGISGDDAVDLFRDFAKGFPDVDLSGLNLSLYFAPEGFPVLTMWSERRPLRVSDLVRVAREKRWRA